MKDQDVLKFQGSLSVVGREIERVERLQYEFAGKKEPEGGDVQLSFGDAVVRLGVAGDGETLRIHDTPWQDPFPGPLSSENAEYVASHGKWTLVDVSRESPFADLVGKTVAEVKPLTNRFGRLIGVQLIAGESVLNAFVEFDELNVTWGDAGVPLWGRECVRDEHGDEDPGDDDAPRIPLPPAPPKPSP